MRTRPRLAPVPQSACAGFRFPPDVIVLAVGWYLRFGLSYRDVEELLAERGIEVDHVTIYRWVQRFTLLLAEAARPCRHAVGDRWWVDETMWKVVGRWRYVYRAIDQFGQVIDVLVSTQRDVKAARRFFQWAIGTAKATPVEVVTDRAPVYPLVLEELLPAAWHCTRAVRQQPGRGRPWPGEGAAATDARPQARPRRWRRDCWARVRPEPSARSLRTGRRGTSEPAADRRVRRTRPGGLILYVERCFSAPRPD
jgi:transposase-like protein